MEDPLGRTAEEVVHVNDMQPFAVHQPRVVEDERVGCMSNTTPVGFVSPTNAAITDKMGEMKQRLAPSYQLAVGESNDLARRSSERKSMPRCKAI